MKASLVRHYKIRLQLLEMGEVVAARELINVSSAPLLFNEVEGKSPDDTFLDCSEEIEALLRRHEERYQAFMSDPHREAPDATARSMQQEVVDEFYKNASATKKCENEDCGCYSPGIRTDVYLVGVVCVLLAAPILPRKWSPRQRGKWKQKEEVWPLKQWCWL